MTSDIIEGKWKQLKGQAKTWWGKLTDDDLDQIGGRRDILVGKLQERYGYAKQHAQDEVDRRLTEWEDAERGSRVR
jgi:uncharacterized protein YjbJ (UPF0337 family)